MLNINVVDFENIYIQFGSKCTCDKNGSIMTTYLNKDVFIKQNLNE